MTFCGTNRNSLTVDKEFVPCIGGEVEYGRRRNKGQAKGAGERDKTSGRVVRRGVDPVGNPDPVCLEAVYSLR